jgi:eukaryotic-like serine/threonine-protein kinase
VPPSRFLAGACVPASVAGRSPCLPPHDEHEPRHPAGEPTLAGDDATPVPDESLESRYLRANVATRLFPGANTPVCVGRFEILEVLGRGAMGVVYRAKDPGLDRQVAIKVLASWRTASAARRSRMLREAQAMAKLSHPHVVTVHEVGEFDDGVFITMELVDGWTLSEWLAEQARSWKQVRDVFVAAGQGLESAHDAGVLHRDFKPDNVMIGRDGRVRVMDFGLAHIGLASSQSSGDSNDELSPEPPTSLTRSGDVLGTPAYMAPEQFRGVTDARSDQFSFCVALFEALFGARPFVGSTAADLLWAAASGEVRFPARARTVPGWLRRAIVRGLAPEPEARHPTMTALLDALRHDRVLARRRTAVAVTAIGALATGAVLAMRPEEPACSGAAESIADAWSESRSQTIDTVFSDSGLPYAAATSELASRHIDDFASRWIEVHTDVCERALRREQSDELLDRRMSCLEEQLRTLDASVGVLERADATVIERALDVVLGLPDPDHCRRPPEAIPATPPSNVAEDTNEVRARLAEADALERAGKWQEARPLAEQALARAQLIGWEPLVAEALRSLGTTATRHADATFATETLTEGFFTASRAGRDDLAVHTAEHLVRALSQLSRSDEALLWARHAELVLQRTPIPDDFLHARLDDAVASALTSAGRLEEASARHAKAIAVAERVLNDDDPRLALVLSNSARSLSQLGHHEEAAARLRRALEIYEASVGAEHPLTAIALNNLGIVLKSLRRPEDALIVHERALAIREKALGHESEHTLASLSNTAIALSALGRHEEALQIHQRALVGSRNRIDRSDPKLKLRIMNVGLALDNVGRREEALAHFEEALELCLEVFGPEHLETAVAYHNLGSMLNDLKRHVEASEHLRRAVALRRQHLGTDHESVARSLYELASGLQQLGRHRESLDHHIEGLAARERNPTTPPSLLLQSLAKVGELQRIVGRRAESLATFERAVALVDQHGLDDTIAGRVRFDLALALESDASARDRATSQVRLALDVFLAHDHPLASDATQWLKQHGGE